MLDPSSAIIGNNDTRELPTGKPVRQLPLSLRSLILAPALGQLWSAGINGPIKAGHFWGDSRAVCSPATQTFDFCRKTQIRGRDHCPNPCSFTNLNRLQCDFNERKAVRASLSLWGSKPSTEALSHTAYSRWLCRSFLSLQWRVSSRPSRVVAAAGLA